MRVAPTKFKCAGLTRFWTYIVSKWSIDPLFKERKDLLAEKKEEPKAAESKSAENKIEPKTAGKSEESKPVPKTVSLPPTPIPTKPAEPDAAK